MDSNTADTGTEGPPAEPLGTGRLSRRLLLIGGVAVVLAAGGGVAAGFIEHVGPTAAPRLPHAQRDALARALAAERELLADVGAALAAQPAHGALRTALDQVHRDHQAHLQALTALVAAEAVTPAARTPSPSPSPSLSPSPSPSPSLSLSPSVAPGRRAMGRAGLRAAETAAGVRSAQLADTMTGRSATVLASIAACEATHAELLAP